LRVKSRVRLAFLHVLLCASCFLAFGQHAGEDSTGLQPGDQVRIRPGKADHGLGKPLRLDLTVDEAGQITLPDFGLRIEVLNLQATEAAALIQSELRETSGFPELEVTVLSSRDGLPLPEQNCLSIGGQVREPGQIPFRPGMTLAEGLEATGGATKSGATTRITLYRDGELFTFDLDEPADAALRLRCHDILEVPAKPWISR
jgi:protein involved in polysaccharide export with SLBB domain